MSVCWFPGRSVCHNLFKRQGYHTSKAPIGALVECRISMFSCEDDEQGQHNLHLGPGQQWLERGGGRKSTEAMSIETGAISSLPHILPHYHVCYTFSNVPPLKGSVSNIYSKVVVIF